MAVSFHQTPKRLLVRGVNWLGDAVMTTPALLRLRERFPDAHVTLLTPGKLRDLYLHHPAVDETISFGPEEGVRSVGRKLRAGNFELAIVLPNSPRSALEVWWAGIPQRIGYSRPWRNLFLTRTVATRPGHVKMRKRNLDEIRRLVAATPSSPGREGGASVAGGYGAHQLHEYLHLVAALGAPAAILPPQLLVKDEEVRIVAERFRLNGQTRWLGINPGAEYGPAKRWPIDYFAGVANELYRKLGCAFLIFGGKGDVPLAEQLLALLPTPASKGHVVSLAGKTSLRELMALLKLCRGLLTNDTGPMHVAAALGTPVVVPFGSTSPELTGPGLPGDTRHRLLKSSAPCSPCFLRECPIDFRCMKGITVEQVTAAARDVFHH